MKPRGLFGEADAQQTVQGERGVANPGVAIVPVALAANGFRQTARGSRDDRAGGLERQQLKRERGALDDFAPAARIGTLRQPAAPVVDGRAKQVLPLPCARTVGQRFVVIELAQRERQAFALAEREIGGHASSRYLAADEAKPGPA